MRIRNFILTFVAMLFVGLLPASAAKKSVVGKVMCDGKGVAGVDNGFCRRTDKAAMKLFHGWDNFQNPVISADGHTAGELPPGGGIIGEKQALCQGGLTAAAMAQQTDITDGINGIHSCSYSFREGGRPSFA